MNQGYPSLFCLLVRKTLPLPTGRGTDTDSCQSRRRTSVTGNSNRSGADVLLAVLPAELNQLRRGVGLLEHRLHVEFAHHRLLFLGRLRQRALLASTGGVLGVDVQAVGLVVEFNAVVIGEDLVAAMLLVPFGDGRVLVHVLDDVSPTDAGVVGAE